MIISLLPALYRKKVCYRGVYLSVRALCVAGTADGLVHAAHHGRGVGDEGGRAGALGPVVHHLALGVRPARVLCARVNTSKQDQNQLKDALCYILILYTW